MRRKSARNAQKATEKPVKEEVTPKTRRSKRRKRSPSKSSESEEEVIRVTKRAPLEETPDTTTKSHSPTDEEGSQEPVWKVTSSEEVPKGEIQKLKICLTRPPPDSPEKAKTRRSKSCSQTEDDATSSEDKTKTPTRRTRARGSPLVAKNSDGLSSQEADDDADEKKVKGKSKGKHKSKILEKSTRLNETTNEICGNVQVTSQSPSKPVDSENDYNRADVGDKLKLVEGNSSEDAKNSDNAKLNDSKTSDDDDEPLSVIKKQTVEDKSPEISAVQNSTEEILNKNEAEIEIVTKPALETEASLKESNSPEKSVEIEQKSTESVQKEAEPEQIIQKTPEKRTVREKIVFNSPKKEELIEKLPEKPQKEESDNILSEKTVEPEKETIIEETEAKPEQIVQKATEERAHRERIVFNSPKKDEIVVKVPEKSQNEEETPKLLEKGVENEETPLEKEPELEQKAPQESFTPEKVEISEVSEKQPDLDLSRGTLNKILNETGDVSMTDLSDDKYIPKPDLKEMEDANTVEDASKKSSDRETQVVTEKTIRTRLKRDNELRKSELKEADEKEEAFGLKPPKRIKWETKSNAIPNVDLESIQAVYPLLEFPVEPDLHLEVQKERRKSTASSTSEPLTKKLDRKVSIEYEKPTFEAQVSIESINSNAEVIEDNSNIIAFNRTISIVDDTASKLKPPPSPAKNPTSDVLFITNLVRPFTVKQLKGLLERTGKIKEEGFWTDRIKSKCYVQYEAAEDAEATRNALHGVQWPIGNGKKLIIDYGTFEDLEQAKNPPVLPPPIAPSEPVLMKENIDMDGNMLLKKEEKPSREVEQQRKIEGPVREWDMGKKELSRDGSRSRDKERGKRQRRSPSPLDDFIARKQKKSEDAVPQRLMDDLFLKTKATPRIYWKPLSPEEIASKQQQRTIRMEEHKRRMAETSRGFPREMRRGSFRRRYD